MKFQLSSTSRGEVARPSPKAEEVKEDRRFRSPERKVNPDIESALVRERSRQILNSCR